MRRFAVALLLFFVLLSQSNAVDLTKSQGEILDWTLLDDTTSNNPFAEATIQTFADDVELVLNIVVAHNDAVDAGNTVVTASVLIRTGADDEGWRLYQAFTAGGDQATAETLAANSGVSQGSPERLEVADTTDWDTGEAQWLFLKDSGTLADSALVFIEGWVDNDYYINAWDLERDYDNADILHNKVDQIPVRIPAGSQFINITFHNTHASATYAVRVDYTVVTDIE